MKFDDEWFRQHRRDSYIKMAIVIGLMCLSLFGMFVVGLK
jgi:hypothetical protein